MNWEKLFDPLNWIRPAGSDAALLSASERQSAARKLDTRITDDSVSLLLLDAILKVVSLKQDAVKTLEGKAASEIGFAGTIVAIFATLGRHDHALWVMIPMALSILCNVRAMLVERHQLPSPILYNIRSVLNNNAYKAPIAAALTESYGLYSLDLGVENGRKSRYVRAGTALLAIGILGAIVPLSAPKKEPVPTTITCTQPRCEVILTKDVDDGR